jgi:hypothetical protein
MHRLISYNFLLVVALFLVSCIGPSPRHWSEGVPFNTPAIVLTHTESDIETVIYSEYAILIDKLSTGDNSYLEAMLRQIPANSLKSEAILIFPHNADEWTPVWVFTSGKKIVRDASLLFSRPFTESSYRFSGVTVYKMYMPNEIILYGIQAGETIFISESSFAVEEIIRTLKGKIDALDVNPRELSEGNIVINTPHFDRFISVETAVRYRPNVIGSLRGSGPAVLKINRNTNVGATDYQLEMKGTLQVQRATANAPIVNAVTTRNHLNILDRYISQDAAIAAFMHSDIVTTKPYEGAIGLDAYLQARPAVMSEFISTLSNNFAMSAFASSGYLAMGEYSYLRIIERDRALVSLLDDWVENGMVRREGSHYFLQSKHVSSIISGGLSEFENYYLTIIGDAVLITQRSGVIQKISGDRSRRRTLYYSEYYSNIRKSFPEQLSGFVYSQSEELSKFVQSMLNVTQSTDLLFDQYDVMAMGFDYGGSRSSDITWTTRTYQVERSQQPFEDRWLIALDDTDLTGPPVLADIGGSSREEILVATTGGMVLALAADGTQVFSVSTGVDRPIGSPIVYDWYSNNQRTIIIGAGNKIYGWSNGGIPLPGFPIVLEENISAPINIVDLTRNGIPEIIVATSDRKLHVLDQRGNNITGWPQSVNATIRNKPLVEIINGVRSVYAYAENVVFGWETNGVGRIGFPVFNRSPLKGEVFRHENHLIAGSADGTILAIGQGTLFSVDYAPIISPGSSVSGDLVVQGIRLSDGGIVVRPGVSSYTISTPEAENVSENMFFAMADNGSIFGINMQGRLRFTQSLGQPSMANHPPVIADINRNGRAEIMALAGFGRLYAWTIQSGERFFGIPTSAMNYYVIADINGNGRMEIVAGTRDGLRSWTINR